MAMKCKELRKLKLNWLNPGAKLLHENAFRKAIRVLSRSCSIFNEIKSSRAISNWCEVLRARAAQICKFNSNFGTARLPFRSTPDRKLIIWCTCKNEMEKNIYNFASYFDWRKLWCCCETFSEKSWQVSDMVMAAVLLVPIVFGQKNWLLSQYLNSLLSILSKKDILWQLKASYCYCYQSQI